MLRTLLLERHELPKSMTLMLDRFACWRRMFSGFKSQCITSTFTQKRRGQEAIEQKIHEEKRLMPGRKDLCAVCPTRRRQPSSPTQSPHSIVICRTALALVMKAKQIYWATHRRRQQRQQQHSAVLRNDGCSPAAATGKRALAGDVGRTSSPGAAKLPVIPYRKKKKHEHSTVPQRKTGQENKKIGAHHMTPTAVDIPGHPKKQCMPHDLLLPRAIHAVRPKHMRWRQILHEGTS